MQLIDQMFEGVEIDAATKEKAKTIVEAAIAEAVATQIGEQMTSINESFETKMTDAKEAFITEQTDSLMAFADMSITEWVKDNVVGLDAIAKQEICESFLESIGEAFGKMNVILPKGDESQIVESLQSEITALKGKLGESEVKLNEAQVAITAHKEAELTAIRESVIATVIEKHEMTDVMAERFKVLTESVQLTESEATFKTKLSWIAEALTGKKITEDDDKDGDKGKDGEKEGGDKEKTQDGIDPEKDEDEDKEKKIQEGVTDPDILAYMNMYRNKSKKK